MAFNQPKAYLITFTCYGTRLHGDDRGTVDDDHNIHGTPVLPTNHDQQDVALRRMNHGRVLLDAPMRTVVDRTIRGVCDHRGWDLLEINVRTNHVHVVVAAQSKPEKVMNDFKAWCTRKLRKADLAKPAATIWTEHGSTRWLFTESAVRKACFYVRQAQGPDLPWVEDMEDPK